MEDGKLKMEDSEPVAFGESEAPTVNRGAVRRDHLKKWKMANV